MPWDIYLTELSLITMFLCSASISTFDRWVTLFQSWCIVSAIYFSYKILITVTWVWWSWYIH